MLICVHRLDNLLARRIMWHSVSLTVEGLGLRAESAEIKEGLLRLLMVTVWGVRGPGCARDTSPFPGDVYEAGAETILRPAEDGADTTFSFNFGTEDKFGWAAFGGMPKND
jgi:hypothetical protein